MVTNTHSHVSKNRHALKDEALQLWMSVTIKYILYLYYSYIKIRDIYD